jgi:hypothetical protein
MALATSITGDGSLTAYSKTVKRIPLVEGLILTIEETTEAETREWVALTEDAAEAAVDEGSGEASMSIAGELTTYENDMREDNRIVHSYTYICRAERKVTVLK